MITSLVLLACLFAFGLYHNKKIKEKENNYQWIWECRDYLQVLVRDYERECRKAFKHTRPPKKETIYSLRKEYEQGIYEKITELSRRRNGRAINLEHIPDFLLVGYKNDLAFIEDIYREAINSLDSRA